jgi:hypothetical protein
MNGTIIIEVALSPLSPCTLPKFLSLCKSLIVLVSDTVSACGWKETGSVRSDGYEDPSTLQLLVRTRRS